jgi:hypothetical protein
MLRELNVVEQRCRAVLEVLDGIPVTEVAERFGVARQTGHPAEARMGLGLFLNSDNGITWWSHSGSVAGFECVLAGVAGAGFAVAAMTNSADGFAVARNAADLVSRLHGPGPLRVGQLPRRVTLLFFSLRPYRVGLTKLGT